MDYEGYLDSQNKPCGYGKFEGHNKYNNYYKLVWGYFWEDYAYGFYQLHLQSMDRSTYEASFSEETNQVGKSHGKASRVSLHGNPCPDLTSNSCTHVKNASFNILSDNG